MATAPDISHLERSMTDLLQLARSHKQELQNIHEITKRNQQHIADLREETIRVVELVNRLEVLHHDTQEHVKRALELVADIHPHVRRIPELHQATEDLKLELRGVKAAAADASKQLHDYSRKLETDPNKNW